MINTISRPQPAIAIYFLNPVGTLLEVKVITNATVIAFRYTATTTSTDSISFVGKSVEQVVQEINTLTIPVKAVALSSKDNLLQGDILPIGSDFIEVPGGFTVFDRLTDNGIILRSKSVNIKHKSQSKIKILPPYLEDSSLPWYPRITNGSFTQRYNNKLYHFYVPEFDNQTWSLLYGKPFKDLKGVIPISVDQYVYQLPRFPIFWTGQNITLYNGNIPLPASIVEDVDINNGLIYLKTDSYIPENLTIDYTYLETSFVFKDININGHFTQNPTVLNKYVCIYLIPVEGETITTKKAVRYVIGDSVEEAIGSIALNNTSDPIAVIGAYFIQPVPFSDKIQILDTRSKGGGLKRNQGPVSPVHYFDNIVESSESDIEERYKEANRFWDIGNIDGIPYPGAAAISIDLPNYLTEVINPSDIQDRVRKYSAAGVYPLVNFSERQLPSVTGMSSQVSCSVNLNFEEVLSSHDNNGLVAESIPSVFTGIGWTALPDSIPTSILETGLWNNFNPTIPIVVDDSVPIIEVGTQTGVFTHYLKSTPIAGITWKERNLIGIDPATSARVYSTWKEKRTYDDREVATGQLIRSTFFLPAQNAYKQYKDIQINSPFHYTGSLEDVLVTRISEIFDATLALQIKTGNSLNGTEIVKSYTDVDGTTSSADDYLLVPTYYAPFFNIAKTPLEEDYLIDINHIGQDFISQCYTSGHFFKFYIQNTDEYVTIDNSVPYIAIDYTSALKQASRYLDFRRRLGIWSGDCDTGEISCTGLVHTLLSTSGTYGSFGPGIPIYWYYFPQNIDSGVYTDTFSGAVISTAAELGGSISEVDSSFNYDWMYNISLPTMLASAIAHQDTVSSTLSQDYYNAYSLTVAQTVNNLTGAIYGERTLSGLPTTSHWFVAHDRLGSYLGRTLDNMIEAYEYVASYLSNQRINDVADGVGSSADFLQYMFSGVENVLYTAYDLVAHNLLRGGIVEADLSSTISAYGWYVNTWPLVYGTRSKLYSNDYRSLFSGLFTNGLKTLLKNQITEDGEMYETTYLNNSIGPFPASVPSKILNPLAQALKLDINTWSGIAVGVINTISNNYSVDGLYYSDPYKESSTPGKEYDVGIGLTNMYRLCYSTGQVDLWEPMADDISTLRGVNFLPPMSSNEGIAGWHGTQTPLAFWKYYQSGDVYTGISILKSHGINTIRVQLDYPYWFYSGQDHLNRFSNLLDSCYDQRMRVIPVLFNNFGTSVSTGSMTDYINSYGHTGGPYRPAAVETLYFMTGETLSGQNYVEAFVTGFDSHPAIVAWDISDRSNSSAISLKTFNSAGEIIKSLTDTPTILSVGRLWTNVERDGTVYVTEDDAEISYTSGSLINSTNFDFIGIQPYNLFDYFIQKATVDSCDYILTNLGDGAYADYEVSLGRATDRNLPFVLSNLFLNTGSYEGIIYSDGTARSSRQLSAIHTAAAEDGVEATGEIIQRRNFNNFYFYPTGYTPSYTVNNLVDELSTWNQRTLALQDQNTGEFYRQVNILTVVQSGLDYMNYKFYSPTTYYIPSEFSTRECDYLNYYRNTWSGANFFSATGLAWTSGGSVDSVRYDTFVTNWGVFLNSLLTRLDINE